MYHQCLSAVERPRWAPGQQVSTSPRVCRVQRHRISVQSDKAGETDTTTTSSPVVVVDASASNDSPSSSSSSGSSLEKDLSKFSRQAAGTFAPRASTASKNPAVKGSLLYDIFEWQAWLALLVGGLLAFNVIFPTDTPSIPRLMGMWSIWMFTVPSLRAKECTASEKDALNVLFLAIPLINVLLPFVWKNFGFIFTADVLALFAGYWYKGVWRDVYGLPLEPPAGGGATVEAPKE